MSSYIRYPASGGSGITTYASFSAFPASASDGAAAIALDTDILYIFNLATVTWLPVASPGAVLSLGNVGSTPSAAGASITSNVLTLQPADATHPGLVNITTQTFAGQKTFSTGLTGTLTGAASLNVLTSALGTLSDAGTDGIVVTGGIGATVGSVSLAQHVADASHNGYLSSADWSTFNGKQASGNYITALTGDGSASGPGSVALTLATVNSNVGSFILSSLTVNAKGLVTAASSALTTGSGDVVLATSPTLVTPALGTPSALVGTNITGTASGLTAGNVTTNANLTGPITSSGNATAIASQTGTGTKFVVDTAPTLVTPNIGTPSAGVLTSCTGLPLTTGVTGTLPIANGGTAVTSVTTAPAATAFAGWDANKNLTANNLIESYTTTATAAGTTTLVVGSTFQQYFTGTTTQTVQLPTTSIVAGQSFLIVNLSTGVVTVQSSGANTVQALLPGTQCIFTAVVATPTTAANWNVDYSQSSSVSQFSLPTVTDWIAYTPTISAGFGTTSSVSFFYSRQGDFLNVRGTFTSGTSAASLGSISLPGGLAIDTAKTPIGNTTGNPGPQIGLFWSNVTNQLGAVISATGTSTSVVYTGNQITNSGSLTPTNVSTVFNGAQFMSIQFSVPVSGWTSNTTVTLGQAPATSQTANTIYSGPSSGSAATPTFRALVDADMPSGGFQPPGAVIMYGAASAPTGWLNCDGSSVLRATYANLFAVIGTTYGSADGTHFTLPDFRGIFPRGSGSNGTLTNANGSAFSGTLGTYQNDKMQGHYHGRLYSGDCTTGVNFTSITNSAGASASAVTTGSPVTDGTNGTPRTGLETNPANLGINFIIKT